MWIVAMQNRLAPPVKSDELGTALQALQQQRQSLQADLERFNGQMPDEAAARLKRFDAALELITRELVNERLELMQLRALAKTWSQLNSSLDFQTVLTQAMEQMVALTGAERGYILWKKPDTDPPEYEIVNSVVTDPTDKRFQISQTIVNRVMQTGEPQMIANAADDDSLGGATSVMHYAIRSVLCVPLKHRNGAVIGVVYAANRLKVGLFSERDLRLLTAVATQASLAIENAEQFTRVKTELQQANAELRQLRISVDKAKLDEKVADITETEYFRHLQERVKLMRRQSRGSDADDGGSG